MRCPNCSGKRSVGDAGGYLVDCPDCNGTGEVEPYCICGKPSVEDYHGREDCPWCGNPRCGLEIQHALDCIEDHP